MDLYEVWRRVRKMYAKLVKYEAKTGCSREYFMGRRDAIGEVMKIIEKRL